MENLQVPHDERVQILNKIPIFAAVKNSILVEIAKKCFEVLLDSWQTLFRKGDKGDTMYVIVRGLIKSHDNDHTYSVMHQQQVFGEYSLLDTEIRSTSVTSITPTLLLGLKQEVFYKVVLKHPDTAKDILQLLIRSVCQQPRLEEKAEGNTEANAKSPKKVQTNEPIVNPPSEDVARRRESTSYSKIRNCSFVSILSIDITGFVDVAENSISAELMEQKKHYFETFDRIMAKHAIDRVDIPGYTYIAAGGISKKNHSNPIDVVCAALAVQAFVRQQKESGEFPWRVRLGVHAGTIITGKKRAMYDAWRNFLGAATKIKNNGKINQVNISKVIYYLIKDYFECEYQGKVSGKEQVEMYCVKRLKKEFAADEAGATPSKSFATILKQARNGY